MPIKTYKPVTNGRRNMTSLTYEEITTSTPEKSSKLTFKSIEVFNYESGKPGVDLKNDSVIDISISHDGNYVVAFCVAQ